MDQAPQGPQQDLDYLANPSHQATLLLLWVLSCQGCQEDQGSPEDLVDLEDQLVPSYQLLPFLHWHQEVLDLLDYQLLLGDQVDQLYLEALFLLVFHLDPQDLEVPYFLCLL